jgi:hypothetical protein
MNRLRWLPVIGGTAIGLIIWVTGSLVLWGFEHRGCRHLPMSEFEREMITRRCRRQRGAQWVPLARTSRRPSL